MEVTYQGRRLGELSLSTAPWSLLAVLIDAVLHAQYLDPVDAFLTKKEISDQLIGRAKIGHDTEYVKGYLFDLRASLNEFFNEHLGRCSHPKGWAGG